MGNLKLPQIAANQDQKEVTSNEADDFLDRKLTDSVAIAMSDADYTLSDNEALRNFSFKLSGTLTAPRNLIVPASEGLYLISNATAQTITVKMATGSGVEIVGTTALATVALVYCDGTNVVLIARANPDFNSLLNKPTMVVDIGITYSGKPPTNLVAVRHPFPFAVSFPENCAHSRLILGTGADAELVVSLKKNDVEFGTATFAPSGTSATFVSSATDFAEGDVLTVVFPAQDSTAADVGGAIYGTR